ncbi:MAG: argininosuccinate lyase [Proteobacteria bacterium]|nr:argininosuccinate lyase [Pseudomonadota bacterium]
MTLYRGRIDAGANALMDALNKSLPVDIRLLPFDVQTNRAWSTALQNIGVFTAEECAAVHRELDAILARYEAGEFDALPDDEDVHTLVERLLTEALGDTGARIHTGRSRNDQVACDLYLYLRSELSLLQGHVQNLVRILRSLAQAHIDTLMAGTTHVQPAQPITLGHYLLSLAFALTRDCDRITDCHRRADRCPLGAGAIAGSGFPVDRVAIARALGFSRPTENSVDTISHRDAAQEAAFAAATLLTHLSRYAEDFITWSNPAFGYVRWDASWSTGSSMMPQKRNPDAMELVRAKASRAMGNVVTLLAMTKGVPLTYAKDLQEDKAALFDALDTAVLTVQVFAEALSSAAFVPERMQAVLTADMLATELADALALKGVPFRTAHERCARFVTLLEEEQRDLLSTTESDVARFFPELADEGVVLSYDGAVARRQIFGGTSATSIKEQLRLLDAWLAQ